MRVSIKHFMLLIVVVMITSLFVIFVDYYKQQQQHTAEVILGSLQDDMSEISYILSKDLSEKQQVQASRALLDRAAANNDFINAIMVLDDQEVLLTTDPYYREAPSKNAVYLDPKLSAQGLLNTKLGLEGHVRFYEGADLKTLNLVFMFDRDALQAYLSHNKLRFLIYFALLPGLVVLLISGLFHYFIIKPLEILRQYAYYQSSVPKAFHLKELEAIRSSMLQTFTRLDQEQEELYNIARTDTLSGLANRNALNEYLKRLIAEAERNHKEFALLFLDLDNFKSVNDALGHHVGDELLQHVASAIAEVLRETDFVARVGGDEFVVVLHDYHDLRDLTQVIGRIQERLSTAWLIQTHPIHVSGSLGVAFYPKDGTDMISLMQHADIAMYEAKKKGKAQYYFFTEALNQEVQTTIALDKAMREALRNDEYQLYYQPKVDVKTGQVCGVEALIRWHSPTEGVIAPDVFIPLAEHNGFIVELGEWVIKTAFSQHVTWREKGLDLSISINLAAQQFLSEQFEVMFMHWVDYFQVDPSKIELEITEYFFLEQSKQNFDVLNQLSQRGFRISLDDFGTGYSSLSYLKQFPVDTLKIDKAFVDDYNTPDGSVFLETMVKMGLSLRMEVIAEGVEHASQLAYLKSIGCQGYQGYFFSKPLPVDEFEVFYESKMRHQNT